MALGVCGCILRYSLGLLGNSQTFEHFSTQCILSFSVAHQLLFCAVKVAEKYATGLTSL